MKIRDRILELRRVKASDLKPAPHNWRTHPKNQHSALRGSLEQLGYYDALIARRLEDGTLEIIDGHLRAEISPDEAVPVLVTDLTEAEAKAALLTHDPLAALAGQDDALLKALADTVDLGDDGLAAMVQDMLPPDADDVVEDEVPGPPADPITRPGDLWHLGTHKVLCADWSLGISRLGSVDTVFVDPPYNVMLGTRSKNFSKRQKGYESFKDDMGAKEYQQWIRKLHIYCKKWAEIIIITPGNANQSLWPSPRWTLAWTKKNGQTRSPLTRGQSMCFACWEPIIIYGKLDNPPQSDVIDCAIARDPNAEEHPCPKPLRLMAQILSWINSNRIILDPCLGSGTTLIAAEQLGHQCYGIEIEPRYCDVIVQRWENLTGKKASRDAQS